MHQPATYWCYMTYSNFRPWWRHKRVKTFFWKNFPENPLTHAPIICQYGLTYEGWPSFKWVIFMHGSPQFSFFWTKYVIFMIYWKFCYRWLILYFSKSTDELSPLLPALVTHVYASSITKFSINHKYDVFCSEKRKFGWTMHKYDSFKRCYEIGIYRS